MRHWVALSLLIVVALPTVAAEGNVQVTAARATVRDDLVASGELAALLFEGESQGTVPSLKLIAPMLTLQNDTSDPTIVVPGVVVVRGAEGVTKTTSSQDFPEAELVVDTSRAGHRANIYALDPAEPPQLAIRGSCGVVAPSNADNVTRLPWTNNVRPPQRVDTKASVMPAPCGLVDLTLTGNLVLSLWEVDGNLSWRGGATRLATGATASTTGPPAGSPFVGRWVETFVVARNATLSTTLSDDSTLYANHLSLEGTYTLELDARTGKLAIGGQELDVGSNTVTLRGTLETTLAGTSVGAPMAIHSSGEIDEARIGTTAVSIATPMEAARFSWLWLAFAGAILLVAALAADQVIPRRWFRQARRWGSLPPSYRAIGGRQTRAAGYWAKGQEWLERGWLRRAAWASGRAIRLRPDSVAHGLLRVNILDELGRDKTALKVLHGLFGKVSPGRERAMVALDIAGSLARLERQQEANTWLARAEDEDADAVEESSRNTYFQQLHGRRSPKPPPRIEADPGFA